MRASMKWGYSRWTAGSATACMRIFIAVSRFFPFTFLCNVFLEANDFAQMVFNWATLDGNSWSVVIMHLGPKEINTEPYIQHPTDRSLISITQ